MKITKTITAALVASQMLALTGSAELTPFLRRDAKDIQATEANMKGALFSYSRDYEKEIDQWVARSILGIKSTNDTSTGNVLYSDFTASIGLDKVSTGGSDADENDVLMLSFAGTAQFATPQELDPFATSVAVTAALIDSTSTEFENHILGGTLDFQFFSSAKSHFLGLGLGKSNDFGPFYIIPEFGMIVEGGSVVSGGGGESSDEFLRAGPRAGLNVALRSLTDRGDEDHSQPPGALSLFTGYEYQWDMLGNGGDRSLFTAEVSWDIGKNLQTKKTKTKLSVAYRKGEIPFSALDDESILVGLSIGF